MQLFSEGCILTVLNDVSSGDSHQNKQRKSGKRTFEDLHPAETFHVSDVEGLESVHSFFCKNAQKQNTWNVNDLQIMISSPVNKICDLS